MNDALVFLHNKAKSHFPKRSPSLFLSGGVSCQSPPELGRQSHLQKAVENTPIPQALKHPTFLNQCTNTHIHTPPSPSLYLFSSSLLII